MTYSEWREANTHYLLVEDNGDIHAEVRLADFMPLERREAFMSRLARESLLKWTEAAEYTFEG